MKEGERMTKAQKVEAYSMRLDGASLREIADKFGVSFQYIQQLFPARKRIQRKYSNIIYPNIVRYLQDNRVTLTALASDCNMTINGLRQFLNGESGGTKSTIDAILKATGMKYEEAFYTRPVDGQNAGEEAST